MQPGRAQTLWGSQQRRRQHRTHIHQFNDFSNVRKYAQWRELVVDDEVDIVDICLPTDLHAPVAIAALTAGKHVLCEKPMALAVGDCERMTTIAEQQNRILMVGQVLRFWPESCSCSNS